ncbi:MAG: hypothetical protein NC548_56555, partial [Lachnospiraceae bacterium]|nr:hypothetical protein [Lachnospiraceae bacterium]
YTGLSQLVSDTLSETLPSSLMGTHTNTPFSTWEIVAFSANAGSATLLSPCIAASTYKSRVLHMAIISSVLALQVGSHRVLSHGTI